MVDAHSFRMVDAHSSRMKLTLLGWLTLTLLSENLMHSSSTGHQLATTRLSLSRVPVCGVGGLGTNQYL